MPIDYYKILSLNQTSIQKNPIDIYESLDRQSDVGPLRPVQKNILTQWYSNRLNDRDLIIKLNTGEGKTLIGLLILQSLINLNKGKCLYICPNKFLAEQVHNDAKKFGIQTDLLESGSSLPLEFTQEKKILITNAYKFFNGKSLFGIENNSLSVQNIILDDAHACIETIKSAFTIKITKKDEFNLYENIKNLFETSLRNQSEGIYEEICELEDCENILLVPYWDWIEKSGDAIKLILEGIKNDNNEIKFAWQLLKNNISKCNCYISSKRVEISPSNIDISIFGSFSNAKRRILMSATTQDDSFFINTFNFSTISVNSPLINEKKYWSGEKMIIFPSLLDPKLTRDTVIKELLSKKHDFGIFSIVPSSYKVQMYQEIGEDKIEYIRGKDINNSINKIKSKFPTSKIFIINNRYDGIDLPDNLCRILIIDELPIFENYADQYASKACPNSNLLKKRIAQKIEQGFGRGVRSDKDYCAIIVLGKSLSNFILNSNNRVLFSEQTLNQIDMGLDLIKYSKENNESTLEMFRNLIAQILNRDEGWKEFYTSTMNSNKNKTNMQDSYNYDLFIQERKSEQFYLNDDYKKAIECTQELLDSHHELSDLEKGWFYQNLARYFYFNNRQEFEKLQKKAYKNNKSLLKPKSGIEYNILDNLDCDRFQNIRDYLKKYNNHRDLLLETEAILDHLIFDGDSDKFENSIDCIGKILGFKSQRPDQKYNVGPDNLWFNSQDRSFFVIECKNRVQTNTVEISKKYSGQMNNHVGWFKDNYPYAHKVIYIMIIQTKNLASNANFVENVRIIRKNGLNKLKNNVIGFVNNMINNEISTLSDQNIKLLLNEFKLNSEDFYNFYSEEYYHKTVNK